MSLMRLAGCVAAALAAIGPPVARAEIYFTEPFNYADGSLVGNSSGAWISHGGTSNQMQVLNQKAIVVNAPTAVASEDVNRDVDSVGTLTMPLGATWYYSALLSVADNRATPGTGSIFDSYFLHLKEDNGTSAFRGRLWVRAGSTPDKFTLGVSSSSFTATGTDAGGQIVSWGSDLTFGTPYTVVVSYLADDNDADMADGDGTAKLWINPVNEASLSVTDAMPHPNIYPRATNDVSDLNHPMGDLALRQGGNGPTTVSIDTVSIGTTFNEVLAAVTPALPTNNSDFDDDGDVDGNDFVIWQRGQGTAAAAGDDSTGDADGDLDVDATDLNIWKSRFGMAPALAAASAVPEPAAAALMACSLLGFAAQRSRRR